MSRLTLHACGPGCTTAPATWTAGTNTLGPCARRGGRGGAAFSVAWPPQRTGLAPLLAMMATMRAQPHVEVAEQVSSGTHVGAPTTSRLDGPTFLETEPYGPTTPDIVAVTTPSGQRSLLVFLSGSLIWGRLTLDSAGRLASEQLIDQGHLIQRTTYPAA